MKGFYSLQNTSDNSIAAEPVSKNGETIFYVRSPNRQSYILTATQDGYESTTETITLDGAAATEVIVKKLVKLKRARIPLKLLISLVDSETQKKIDGKVTLTSPAGQQTGNSLFRDGFYQFDLNSDGKEYRVAVEKPGYLFINQPIYLELDDARNGIIERVISLSKLKPGSVGTLNNIYFDFASSIIREQSFTELKQLEKILKENPGMHIEITGHTDNIGTTEFNQRLSELRAKAVKTYFVSNNISADRILTQGFGETRPLVSNDDEKEGRQFNRRVEFRIIK
jgi:outer membrane protein OmpA-like peptidoglycan-associated protein